MYAHYVLQYIRASVCNYVHVYAHYDLQYTRAYAYNYVHVYAHYVVQYARAACFGMHVQYCSIVVGMEDNKSRYIACKVVLSTQFQHTGS